MVQVDLFNVPDFTEIILEIDVVPSGIAVVITADFLACNDLGIVGIILTASSLPSVAASGFRICTWGTVEPPVTIW